MSEPLPETMKGLVLHGPGDLRLESLSVPTPSEGEVLVKVRAATTCGTDLKAFLRGHPQIPMPGPLGHEYSGVVAAVGSGTKFKVGDEVMGVHSAPCQACRWCARGQENLCETVMATKVLGAYAEYLLVPDRVARLNLFAKPRGLSFEQAALLEPLACVAQGVSMLPGWPQARVLVIGPGAIGLMFVASLVVEGREVTLAGRNPQRLAVGASLGANAVELAALDARFDIVVECTGKVEVWHRAFDLTERGGTLMLFGGLPAGSQVTLDATRLHYEQVTVVSPFHFGTAAVRQAADWLANGLDLSPLVSGRRTLDQASETFSDLERGVGIKYAFHPGD